MATQQRKEVQTHISETKSELEHPNIRQCMSLDVVVLQDHSHTTW